MYLQIRLYEVLKMVDFQAEWLEIQEIGAIMNNVRRAPTFRRQWFFHQTSVIHTSYLEPIYDVMGEHNMTLAIHINTDITTKMNLIFFSELKKIFLYTNVTMLFFLF